MGGKGVVIHVAYVLTWRLGTSGEISRAPPTGGFGSFVSTHLVCTFLPLHAIRAFLFLN